MNTAAVAAAESAMAAAIVAAAELASQGGMTLFQAKEDPTHGTPTSPESGDEREHSTITSESERADNDDSEGEGEGEEDAEKRLSRSRERNREHARRTRLRKKAQLDALQQKVKLLEAEGRALSQSIEECSIASILVGFSASRSQRAVVESLLDCSETKKAPVKLFSGKRKRFVAEDVVEKVPKPLKLIIDGEVTFIGGGKTHINWKTGVYCDDLGVQRQLTQDQLESLRRERNRMHAKMTRDRKKCFIAAVETTIEELQSYNQRMRDAIAKVAELNYGSCAVTPNSSPILGSIPPFDNQTGDTPGSTFPPRIVPHGFSLSGP